jgi:hypothetical protein
MSHVGHFSWYIPDLSYLLVVLSYLVVRSFSMVWLDRQYSIVEMENIMDVIHITHKGRMMDTIEKYYIYKETKLNNQINDKITGQPNVIFETLVQQDAHRGHGNTLNQQTGC